MQKMLMAAVLLAGITGQAVAATDFYAVAGAQFSRSGEPFEVSGAGYQLGAGFVINPQWSVEISAEQLFAAKKQGDLGPRRLDSDALTFSVLGKTRISDDAVLFYRAGASSVDHQGFYPYQVSKKTLPDASVVTVVGYKDIDDDLVHGLLGLGLEQNFSAQWFGRAEIVHLFKKNELQADTFRLSVGYRF